MDHSTRRFIGVMRQFLALVRKLKKNLHKASSDLNSALHKQTEEISKSYKGGNDKQRPSPEVISVANFPEAIEVHQDTKDARRERHYRCAMFFITALTLGAIVVYADLVFLQYREMIKATRAAQQALVEARLNRLQADKAFNATVEQFHLDQRAWVGIKSFHCDDCKGDIKVGANNVAVGTFNIGEMGVTFTNTGKTPALSMVIDVAWVKRKMSQPIPDFEATEEERRKFWETLTGGKQTKMSPQTYQNVFTNPKLVLPPNGIHETTLKGFNFPFTPNPPIDDRLVMYFVGKITYNDTMTNVLHTTRFCLTIEQSGGVIHYCKTGNSMD